MPESQRRYLTIYSLFGLAFIAPIWWHFYRPAGGLLDTVGYHLGRDFINMWTGPQVLDRFGVMMLMDLKGYHWAQSDIVGFLIHFHNWSYPLDVLFIAYPLSWMPYLAALAVWTAAGLAIYIAVVGSRIPREQRTAALVFLLIAPGTIVNLIGGQNAFFTTGLILGAIALWDRRPYVAGVLIGVLTMKPHLGILIAVALVATGNWRAIASATATAVLLIGASIAMWGIDPWLMYLTRTSSYTYRVLQDFEGFQTYMTMSVLSSMRAFGIPVRGAETIQAIVSVIVIALTAISFRRTQDVALRSLLIAAGTFLASPYVFNYDLPILTAAMLWVIVAHPVSRREIVAFGAAWVLAAALWTLHMSGLGLSPFACGAAFAVAVAKIWRPVRASEGQGAPAALPQAV